MKILLTTLNSKYVHSNLALKTLYAAALPKCDSLEIREFTINNEDDYIFTELLREEYDMICFSCYIWNIEKIFYLAENLKKAHPKVKLVLGGPEVSVDAVNILKERKFIDFIALGEGEYTFGGLCEAFNAGTEQYEKIKGLVYRKDGRIYVNQPAELLVFESIPFPYDFLPCEPDKVVYYESTRGCPGSCSYCLSSIEKKVRVLSLERVLRDVHYFIHKNVMQVKFVDRTFNWNQDRCIAVLKYIIEQDLGTTNFHMELCGELIDDEFLKMLSGARKGLFQFEIGIQSTNPKTLRAVNRSDATSILLEKTRKLIALGNVHTHVDLIAGLPFEDYNSFRNSFNDVYALGADMFQLGFLKLLRGTDIRRTAMQHRYVYRRKAPYEVISNDFISANDMARLKRIEAVLDLYYNRGGFGRTLSYMIKYFVASPFDFYEEFSIFYSLRGYQHRSHNKEDLYRILYDYACWKGRKISIEGDEILRLLMEDMKDTLNPDAIKKFERKGWSIMKGVKNA